MENNDFPTLGQLQRATVFGPSTSVWVETDRNRGPTRRPKQTGVYRPPATHVRPKFGQVLRQCGHGAGARTPILVLPLARKSVARRPFSPSPSTPNNIRPRRCRPLPAAWTLPRRPPASTQSPTSTPHPRHILAGFGGLFSPSLVQGKPRSPAPTSPPLPPASHSTAVGRTRLRFDRPASCMGRARGSSPTATTPHPQGVRCFARKVQWIVGMNSFSTTSFVIRTIRCRTVMILWYFGRQ